MRYIKIDYSNLQQVPQNHIYFIELNDDNSLENLIIVGINKEEQERNKLVYGNSSGTSWKWLEGRKFSDDEIKKYKISKEEFHKNREEAVWAERKNNLK